MREGGFADLEKWRDAYGAEVVATAEFSIFARYGAEPWHVLRIPAIQD
jgi:hypothetical protein